MKKEEKRELVSKELVTNEKEVVKPTTKELKEEIAKAREIEIKIAYQEVQTILQKYNCGLDAEVLITSKGVIPSVKIVDLFTL